MHTTISSKDKLVLRHLSQFVSDHKKEVVSKVLERRTRQIAVVLEDIFQSQNASAVMRTAECMGIQDIYIIEQLTKYSLNPRVLKGADKWLSLIRYNRKGRDNTGDCFDELHRNGYRILVADPSPEGVSIDSINVDGQKLALVFGNELRGVSQSAMQHCDTIIRIPMFGFTESLNVSVSVAICLNILIPKLHTLEENPFISEEEKDILRLSWFRKIVRRSDLIEQEFLRTIE